MTQISEFSLAFYLVTSFYSIRLVNCRKRLITGSKVHAWTHVVYFPLWDVFDNSLIIYSCFVRSPLANTTDVIAHAYVRATLMDVEVIETQFLNFSSPNFLVVAVQRDIPGTYLELRSRSNGPILWAMNPGTAYWTRFDREHSIVGWIQKGFWVDLCPSIPGSGEKGGGGGGGGGGGEIPYMSRHTPTWKYYEYPFPGPGSLLRPVFPTTLLNGVGFVWTS